MYITEILGGRPYQCFVPKPMFPAIDPNLIESFSDVDRHFRTRQDDDAFFDRSVEIVLQASKRKDIESRRPLPGEELRRWLIRPRMGIKQLQDMHAFLLGTGTSDFRTGPVWLGGPHPASAWHVGSPPARVNRLMKELVEVTETPQPATVQALTAMLRLLQIHPFQNGNGRVARGYAIWLAHRRIGPSIAWLDLLEHVLDRSRFGLSAASVLIQESGSFDPFTKQILSLSKQIVQNATPPA
jgi:hypothetical protein